jgi:surfactin synthase thioesterase subunit
MSFTSSSSGIAVHESSQMRYYVLAPRPDAAVRLVCFPHAGGTAASYAGWARALEPDAAIEVIGAELPGRDRRSGDAPCTDLDRIVGGFLDLLAPLLDRPLALFGHSLGAIAAFEIARRLRHLAADAPAHLFVSGACAPQLARSSDPLTAIDDDAAFLEAVSVKYGGVPRIVLEQAELRTSAVSSLRADLVLTDTYVYRPAPPLACPIAAYAGAGDPIVSADQLEGWREQTTSAFSSRRFDGHHFYLNRAREALLADITRRLRRLF